MIQPYSQNVYMMLLQMGCQVPYKWPDRNPWCIHLSSASAIRVRFDVNHGFNTCGPRTNERPVVNPRIPSRGERFCFRHGQQRRAQEEGFLQGLLEEVAPLLPGEPIAQVREGDEPPSSAEQAAAAAAAAEHRYHDDPREQSLLLHRPVTPIYTCIDRDPHPSPSPTGCCPLACTLSTRCRSIRARKSG